MLLYSELKQNKHFFPIETILNNLNCVINLSEIISLQILI